MTNPDVEKIATSRGKTDQNRKHGPLPLLEISLYWVLWISLLLYTMYTIFTASQGKKGWTSFLFSSKKRTQLAPEIYIVRTVNRGGGENPATPATIEYVWWALDDMGELAYSKGNKFVMDVKMKATGDTKRNDSCNIFQYLTVSVIKCNKGTCSWVLIDTLIECQSWVLIKSIDWHSTADMIDIICLLGKWGEGEHLFMNVSS